MKRKEFNESPAKNKDKLPTNFFSKTTNKISKTTISGQDHSKLGPVDSTVFFHCNYFWNHLQRFRVYTRGSFPDGTVQKEVVPFLVV